MDLAKVLSQLREELNNLDAAILSLERLQQEGRRRGRPPKILAEVKETLKSESRSVTSRPRPAAGGRETH